MRLPSGAALRRLAIPTVNRIRDVRTLLEEAIKDVIVGQVELNRRRRGASVTSSSATRA